MPVSRLATIKCNPWGPGAGEVGGQWAMVLPSHLLCLVRDGARSFEQGQRTLCADKPQGRISKMKGTKEEKGNCQKQLWSTTTTFNNVQPFWGALDASQECCDGTTWTKAFGVTPPLAADSLDRLLLGAYRPQNHSQALFQLLLLPLSGTGKGQKLV